jgi:predicted nucleotidyltransferase
MSEIKTSLAPIAERIGLDSILKELESRGVLGHTTIVLIGSAARGTETRWSDIDLLIITQAKIALWIPPTDVQLHFETRARFIERLERGDDFPSWALRFGEVLVDSDGWWQTVLADTRLRNIWPDWHTKVLHAQRRLTMAEAVLETGDIDAAWEEYLFAASNLARAQLLKATIFPLSRAELPKQLMDIKDNTLASALESLISEEPAIGKIRKIGVCLKKRLFQLKRH